MQLVVDQPIKQSHCTTALVLDENMTLIMHDGALEHTEACGFTKERSQSLNIVY